MKFNVVIFFAVFLQAHATQEILKDFEFEHALLGIQNNMLAFRSNASGGKTLRLEDENGMYRVEMSICLRQHNTTINITFSIGDIRYSNDGPSDIVSISFDGLQIANFSTNGQSRDGEDWNVFRHSGPVSPALDILPGRHILQVRVITDPWGLELDRIRFNLSNQDPLKEIFCGGVVYSVE